MFSKDLKEYRVAESGDKKKLHYKNETISWNFLNAATCLILKLKQCLICS